MNVDSNGHAGRPSLQNGRLQRQQEVNDHIRSSSMVLTRSMSRVDPHINPFLEAHPELDPSSPHFNSISWAKAFLRHSIDDPEQYPRHRMGVAYQSLSVHGFGKETDYQKTVANVFLQAAGMVRDLMAPSKRRRIDILTNFDGLVKSGEMLLVLGRPGSGVTTLLKTIAGETNGLHVDDKSHFNYQGMSLCLVYLAFH